MSAALDSAPVVCLTGPTAAGKSAAVQALARRWPVEIINVDSATIYRGMDIGTAKPSREEQAQVTHHLLDIRDPAERYSAAAFCEDARRHIAQIRQRGHIPVLCGGTMLYLKALREGLAPLPQADAALREALEARAAQHGWPALHAELARHDPQTATRLAPQDRQRIQRALEVFHATGRTLSDWLAQARHASSDAVALQLISLEPADRAGLHARIAERFHAMMAAGFLAEVAALHARPDLTPALPALRCVGYRQLYAYLAAQTGLDAAVAQAIAATRQLAKRQLTWLRALPQRERIDCLADAAHARVVDAVARLRPR